MAIAYFRFYATLNDLLPSTRRQRQFEYQFGDTASVKDIIESFGIPHPEVDLILVNSEPVDFSYLIADGDRISVYPHFSEIDISTVTMVRPAPLTTIKFILDVHLGKLAANLRLLGFDTLYRNDYDDPELAEISAHQARILLTRDLGLLKRGNVAYGYWVRATNLTEQMIEVIDRFNLIDSIKLFQRCMNCNGELQPVAKEAIIERIPPKTREYFEDFHICQSCQQIYWAGSHYQRMVEFVEGILVKFRKNLATEDTE